MSLIEYLKRLDKFFFILIHNDSDHRVLDNIMLGIGNQLSWIPIYIFMIFFAFKKGRNKAWILILLSLMTIAIADCITELFLRPVFSRVSPCFDPEVHNYLRSIIECKGKYSFPSSIATNCAALTSFWYWSFYNFTGRKWKWLWIWLLLVCYAQIYVGGNFPSDEVAGSVLGVIIGATLAKIFKPRIDANLPIKNLLLFFKSNHTPNSP
jgi:undecaprenyl-diphosphatase